MAALGPLANLARWYGALTARHWAVQPLVSATLAGSGDTVAQLVGEGKSFMAGELDARRTAAFATFGFAYSGMVIPRWFKFLASQVRATPLKHIQTRNTNNKQQPQLLLKLLALSRTALTPPRNMPPSLFGRSLYVYINYCIALCRSPLSCS